MSATAAVLRMDLMQVPTVGLHFYASCFPIVEVVMLRKSSADVLFRRSFSCLEIFVDQFIRATLLPLKHRLALVSVWPGIVVNLCHVGRS